MSSIITGGGGGGGSFTIPAHGGRNLTKFKLFIMLLIKIIIIIGPVYIVTSVVLL